MNLLRGRLGVATRLGVSVVAMAILAAWIDWKDVLDALSRTRPLWLGSSLLLLVANSLQQAARWRGMLGRGDIPLLKFLHFVFVGHYLNLFLPSQAGSDAIKAIAFGRKHGDIGMNVGVQVAMKLTGLVALALFAGLGFLLYLPRLTVVLSESPLKLDLSRWGLVGAVLLALCLAVAAWIVFRFRKTSWVAPLRELAVNPRYLGESMLWSLTIQLTSSLALYCQFRALLADPDLGMILFFTSIAQVMLLLPLSIGGVGVREWVLITLFHTVGGMPKDAILAIALVGYANLVALALAGGLWIAFRSLRGRS